MEEYIVRVYEDKTEWLNKENKYHRLDGPAVEHKHGRKFWYQNGQYHRINGPAIEFPDGAKLWYQNGKPHRIDGPACEFFDGSIEWWIEGKQYTEKEFKDKLNPAVELTVDEISKRLGFTVKVVGEK